MIGNWLRTWFLSGWAGLGWFWAVIAALSLLTLGTLAVLGPPTAPPSAVPPPAASSATPPAAAPPAPAVASPRAAPPADQPGRDTPGPIVDADPALLEPFPGGSPGEALPRIAADGRRPMQVYAAPFDPRSQRPRVGLVLAGIGMNEADSLTAATILPGGVTFAVSPYARSLSRVASAARLAGHELLLSIPMEPVKFPIVDPGPRALMTSLTPERNREQLLWALSRVEGYVGATNALGEMRGERLSGMTDQIGMVLLELDRRGLLFVDARPDAGPNRVTWGRTIDIVVDEIATEEQIDLRLEALSRLARDRGAALGLATLPRPVTIDRIRAWTTGLLNKGLALAPVTAIARPPTRQDEVK
jgi:polysaccharide deacetylase 2 family uncharacterized protein YibQ